MMTREPVTSLTINYQIDLFAESYCVELHSSPHFKACHLEAIYSYASVLGSISNSGKLNSLQECFLICSKKMFFLGKMNLS